MDKSFSQRVYDVVKKIPSGKVLTYKDVTALAGSAKAARAVGSAMKCNPDKSTIPCHRVVGSDGSMHGYAFGGEGVKIDLLKKEGATFKGKRVDLEISRWKNFS